ncbi:hypothetical protein D3C72_1804570 [compost metagenome]
MIRFFIVFILEFPIVSHAEEAVPNWLTKEKLVLIEKIGINPQSDVSVKGNYRYGYVAKKELTLNGYSCPVGTLVDVSRSIIHIRASKEKPCFDMSKKTFENLKLNPDSSVTPI